MIKSALLVTTLSMLIAPAGADAATRYAAVGGAGVAGPCSQEAPCSLRAAIGLAADGDRVVVTPGAYPFEHALDVSDRRLEIVAASPAARPVLTSTVAGGTVALTVGPGSLVRDLDIVQAGGAGFALRAEGTVERVRFTLTAPLARGIQLGRDVTIRDTTIFGTGEHQDGIVAYAQTIGGAIRARLRNVTAVLDGEGSVALEAHAAAGGPVDIDARALLLRGAAEDAVIYGFGEAPATMRAVDSNMRNAQFVARVLPSSFEDLGGVTDAEPVFVDRAAGDLRPAAGSPTIDAGSTDEHSGGRDVAGLPRTQGAAADIGAHEHIVAPPVRVVGAPEVTTDSVTATAEIVPGPWRLTARWRLEVHGAHGLVAAGPSTLALFSERQTRTLDGLTPGTDYRVLAVATGGFGERVSAPAHVTTVAAAGGDQAPLGGGVEPPAVAPPAAPAPVHVVPGTEPAPAPTVAPRPSVRRDRTAPRARLVFRGRGVRITLSEAARVTMQLRGRGGKRLRSRTLRARRGTTTVRVPRITRGVCAVRLIATDAAGNRSVRTFTRRCRA